MEERLLTIDSYNVPKVEKGVTAAVRNIIRLILLEPGSDPLHPYMGVGLYSKYRYGYSDEVKSDIKDTITSQISTYMPDLLNVSVETATRLTKLYITIKFNETVVTLQTDDDNKTLSISDMVS